MRLFLILLCFGAMRAQVVDRLAIAVGHQVITELQLDEELRTTAMLNHKPVTRDLESRRQAADRLVQQLLIKSEMELSHYPLPEKEAIDRYLNQIKELNGGNAGYQKALKDFELNEDTLREHLELQLTSLQFIGYRFRPDSSVSDADVEAAYKQKVAFWKFTHTGEPPSLDAAREVLRTTLVEERTDAALSNWLAESRKQVNIVYFDKDLQ
jgi:hypothetical protein